MISERRYFTEVRLLGNQSIVLERLKTIGILDSTRKIVYQTCHLLNVSDRSFIVHFKELFSLFSFCNYGKVEDAKIRMNTDDFTRREFILGQLLREGLIDVDKLLRDELVGWQESAGLFLLTNEDPKTYEYAVKVTL